MEWTDLGFRAEQVSRSDLDRRGSKGGSRNNAARIGNATSGDHGHLHGIHDLRHQRHSACLGRDVVGQENSTVPTRLIALSNDGVAPLILQPSRLIHCGGRRDDLCAGRSYSVQERALGQAEVEADDLEA